MDAFDHNKFATNIEETFKQKILIVELANQWSMLQIEYV